MEDNIKEKMITGKIEPGKNLKGTYGVNIMLDPISASPTTKARNNFPAKSYIQQKTGLKFMTRAKICWW